MEIIKKGFSKKIPVNIVINKRNGQATVSLPKKLIKKVWGKMPKRVAIIRW